MTSTQIDHIVLLVDTPFFENLPTWVTDNFTVTPGGYHDGQPSRNKLVIFADGSYLSSSTGTTRHHLWTTRTCP